MTGNSCDRCGKSGVELRDGFFSTHWDRKSDTICDDCYQLSKKMVPKGHTDLMNLLLVWNGERVDAMNCVLAVRQILTSRACSTTPIAALRSIGEILQVEVKMEEEA